MAVSSILAALAVLAASTSRTRLSDADLTAYAAAPYDKAAKSNTSEVLGRYHGRRVVVDFPCSDVCPNYTVRIIHFDVEPGAACERLGGKTLSITVPVGIAARKKPFCVPGVLAGNPQVLLHSVDPSAPRAASNRHRRHVVKGALRRHWTKARPWRPSALARGRQHGARTRASIGVQTPSLLR